MAVWIFILNLYFVKGKINEKDNDKKYKSPAPNERFHASGGVLPQKVLREFESLSPARTFVEPPPA